MTDPSEEPLPPTWDVTVAVPLSLPFETRDSLFNAIADVADEWEPKDRKDWDVFVHAHPSAWDRIDAALKVLDEAEASFRYQGRISELPAPGPIFAAIRSALKGTQS